MPNIVVYDIHVYHQYVRIYTVILLATIFTCGLRAQKGFTILGPSAERLRATNKLHACRAGTAGASHNVILGSEKSGWGRGVVVAASPAGGRTAGLRRGAALATLVPSAWRFS